VLVVPLDQELHRPGDLRGGLRQCVVVPEDAEHGGADSRLGRDQGYADRGAQVQPEVAHRSVGEIRQLLQGIERRLPFRDGALGQVEVVADHDRADRFAGRHRLLHRGDLPLVGRAARPASVAGCVDAGHTESGIADEPMSATDHWRRLAVPAAAVP
jgi:hypothetical protein